MGERRTTALLDVPVSIPNVAYDLAKDVESYVEDMRYNLLPDSFRATLFCDLLNAAISEVDWREIATSYVTEWVDEVTV